MILKLLQLAVPRSLLEFTPIKPKFALRPVLTVQSVKTPPIQAVSSVSGLTTKSKLVSRHETKYHAELNQYIYSYLFIRLTIAAAITCYYLLSDYISVTINYQTIYSDLQNLFFKMVI